MVLALPSLATFTHKMQQAKRNYLDVLALLVFKKVSLCLLVETFT